MKKFAWFFCLGFGMALSACGSSSTPPASTGVLASGTPRLDASSVGEAPVEIQLLIGTLKLEGTDLAVTPDQAAALLPLWREIQDLLRRERRTEAANPAGGQAAAGDPATQAQIDGLLERIKAEMTGDQIAAIARMQITTESAAVEGQALLDTAGGPGGKPADGRTRPATGDGLGGGNPPPGGWSGQGGGMELMLLRDLIQTLESRAGGTPAPK